MRELITIEEGIIKIPEDWNYDHSVKENRNLFKAVREKGREALTELRIAHEILTKDAMLKMKRRWPDKDFGTYCRDIEIDRKTGYRWLAKYFPNYYSQIRRIGANATIALPEGKYNVILADPPWKYEFSLSERGDPQRHYPVLTKEEISNYQDGQGVRIRDLFSSNAVLLLWATNPKLEEALEVMKNWGFEYRTNLVWIKDRFGTGYWFRGQHELLLLGIKGNPQTPLPSNRPTSVLKASLGRHSEKPEALIGLIEKMFPNRSYLELFGRKPRKGWKVWGNEVYEKG